MSIRSRLRSTLNKIKSQVSALKSSFGGSSSSSSSRSSSSNALSGLTGGQSRPSTGTGAFSGMTGGQSVPASTPARSSTSSSQQINYGASSPFPSSSLSSNISRQLSGLSGNQSRPSSSSGRSGGGGGGSSSPSGSDLMAGVGGAFSSFFSRPPKPSLGEAPGRSLASNESNTLFGGQRGIERTTMSGPTGAAGGRTLEGMADDQNRDQAFQTNQQRESLVAQRNALQGQLQSLLEKRAEQERNQVPTAALELGQEPPPFRSEYDEEISQSEKQLKQFEKELAKLEAASPEEQGYQNELNDLLASKELGKQAVSEQPIPLGFITGQQTAIERRAANRALPLENRLAALQAKRKAASDVVRSRLSSVGSRYDNLTSNRRSEEEEYRAQQRELAEQEAKRNEPFNLSEGQTRFDPVTGLPIASVPKTYKPDEPTQSEVEAQNKFLDRSYLQNLFSQDQLKQAAKEAGFTQGGGFLGIGVGQEGIDAYLNSLEQTIQQYRTAGYTDKEILKMMQ